MKILLAVGVMLAVLQAPVIETSANPVRGSTVTFHWPAGSGSAIVDVFSVTGTRVTTTTLAPDPGRWQWDLTTLPGQPVANGGYYVVVTRSDGVRMRRRQLVAR